MSMSEWDFNQMDQKFCAAEDRRAENARIIKSHAEIKPEFMDGSTILKLMKLVEVTEKNNQWSAQVKAWNDACDEADECELCGDTGEYIEGRSDSDWGEVKRCDCPAGKRLP